MGFMEDLCKIQFRGDHAAYSRFIRSSVQRVDDPVFGDHMTITVTSVTWLINNPDTEITGDCCGIVIEVVDMIKGGKEMVKGSYTADYKRINEAGNTKRSTDVAEVFAKSGTYDAMLVGR